MLTDVFYISLTGIGVVFSFLFIIFLLLKGLKIFAVKEEPKKMVGKTEEKGQKESSKETVEGSVSPEVIAAIMAVLNKENLLTGREIVIRKK